MMPVRLVLGAVTLASLTLGERLRPLRRPVGSAWRRLAVNLAVAALAFGAVALVYGTVVVGAIAWAERHGVGLVRWLGVPSTIASVLAVVLLDYTLWHWHWLNHRVGVLWRFHAAHHADVDLDASTALRFHPGELVISVLYRALQVIAIGVSLDALAAWETLVLVFTMFHHSNLRLGSRFERVLGAVVITPRVHGIHHSRRPRELHSNFGTLSSVWDRLHGLRVTEVDQASIEIGIPGEASRVLGVAATLALSFRAEVPAR